jgi:hypothetical protein
MKKKKVLFYLLLISTAASSAAIASSASKAGVFFVATGVGVGVWVACAAKTCLLTPSS